MQKSTQSRRKPLREVRFSSADWQAAGWEAVDAMADLDRQRDAASQLGITPQAMSRRLQVAGWTEEKRARELAAWVLEQGEGR